MISPIPIDETLFDPPAPNFWFARKGIRACRAQFGVAAARMADELEWACSWGNSGYVSVEDFIVKQTLTVPVPRAFTEPQGSFAIDEPFVRRVMEELGFDLSRFEVAIYQCKPHWYSVRHAYIIRFPERPSAETLRLAERWEALARGSAAAPEND